MDMINTYTWSQNLQGLENNIVDCVKADELEVIISPNRSPVNPQRGNSKKPSRVVVPSNRQLSFYNAVNKPAAGIYLQAPMKSMPFIHLEGAEDESRFNRKEAHSPSLQILPTYQGGGVKSIKSELNTAVLLEKKSESKGKNPLVESDRNEISKGFLFFKFFICCINLAYIYVYVFIFYYKQKKIKIKINQKMKSKMK